MNGPQEVPQRESKGASGLERIRGFLPGESREKYPDISDPACLAKLIEDPAWGLASPYGLRVAVEELQDATTVDAIRSEPDFPRYRNSVAGAIKALVSELGVVALALENAHKSLSPDSKAAEIALKARRALEDFEREISDDTRKSEILFKLRGLHNEGQRVNRRKWVRVFGSAASAAVGVLVWLGWAGYSSPTLWVAALGDPGTLALVIFCAILSLAVSKFRLIRLTFQLRHWQRLSPDGNENAGLAYALRDRPKSVGWLWNWEARFRGKAFPSPLDHFVKRRFQVTTNPNNRVTKFLMRCWAATREGAKVIWAMGLAVLGTALALGIGYAGKDRLAEDVRVVVSDVPAFGLRCEVVEGKLLARAGQHLYVGSHPMPMPSKAGLQGTGEQRPQAIRAIPLESVDRIGYQGDRDLACQMSSFERAVNLPWTDILGVAGGPDTVKKIAKRAEELAVTLLCVQGSNRGLSSQPRNLLLGGHVTSKCSVSSTEIDTGAVPK